MGHAGAAASSAAVASRMRGGGGPAGAGSAAGGGVFVVMDAVAGMPAGIFQENRFMTDLRTGAAGGLALKHCAVAKDALGSTKRRPAAATSFERF